MYCKYVGAIHVPGQRRSKENRLRITLPEDEEMGMDSGCANSHMTPSGTEERTTSLRQYSTMEGRAQGREEGRERDVH